jgi:ketosteroid isomerase-like protein
VETVTADGAELTRRFTDAFNARDAEALQALVTDDVEFRNPQGGASLIGSDGVRALLATAEQARLRLVAEGGEQVGEDGRVAVPVRLVVGKDHLEGTALFEIRAGRIAAFEVVSELVRT